MENVWSLHFARNIAGLSCVQFDTSNLTVFASVVQRVNSDSWLIQAAAASTGSPTIMRR